MREEARRLQSMAFKPENYDVKNVLGEKKINDLLLEGASWDEISSIAQRAPVVGDKAQKLISGVPSYPTMDSLFAESNKDILAKYNAFIDLRITNPDDAKAHIERLVPVVEQKQQEWLAQYGDTPEAKAIQQEPVPTWESTYLEWLPSYQKKFNSEVLNRPWYSDQDSINQKKALDKQYIEKLNAYNEKYGTNFKPSDSVLGKDAQPSIYMSAGGKKKWYEDPMNLLALGLGGYGLYSLATAGTAGAAAAGSGAAGGTAIGTSASVAPGSLAATLGELGVATAAPATAIPGSYAATIPAALSAGNLGSLAPGLLLEDIAFVADDAAQLFEQTKSISAVQQNLIAAGVDPVVAAEASNLAAMGGGAASVQTGLLDAFAGEPIFTNSGLLEGGATLDPTGKAVSTVSSSTTPIDPIDALRKASQLVGQAEEPAAPPVDQYGGMPTQGGQVDYSTLLELLALQARTPGVAGLLGPAQLMPQYNPYSLLG